MIVKIAGIWEMGWSAPLTEHSHWHYPLRDFKVDEFIMCPVSGIAEPVKEYAELSLAIAANPDLQVVFVDEQGTETLSNFVHPENALYVFGKASQSPLATYYKEGDLSLRIETPANAGLLWPHQAAAILLYDRMLKQK